MLTKGQEEIRESKKKDKVIPKTGKGEDHERVTGPSNGEKKGKARKNIMDTEWHIQRQEGSRRRD